MQLYDKENTHPGNSEWLLPLLIQTIFVGGLFYMTTGLIIGANVIGFLGNTTRDTTKTFVILAVLGLEFWGLSMVIAQSFLKQRSESENVDPPKSPCISRLFSLVNIFMITVLIAFPFAFYLVLYMPCLPILLIITLKLKADD